MKSCASLAVFGSLCHSHLHWLSRQPLGISEYELEKFYPEKIEGTIPSIEEIEAKLNIEDDETAEIE